MGETDNERGEVTVDETQRFKERLARKLEERARALVQAKIEAEASGKQAFDLAAFEATYVPSSPPSKAPPEERTRQWENDYYLTCRDIMTIVDFARWVEQRDLYDGGDMHLDKW